MIRCNTTAGRFCIEEHTADAREIGYGFSTLPEFRAEEQVKIQYHKQILDAQERAAYLQFLHDLGELWEIIPASSLVYLSNRYIGSRSPTGI